jgi:hypothetical protein
LSKLSTVNILNAWLHNEIILIAIDSIKRLF